MTEIELVKQLRTDTGLGVGDCRSALERSSWDLEKAKLLLRTEGKKSVGGGAATREGTLGRYIHHNGQLGAIVEVNCQTDFTARNSDFQDFANKVAMHIASMNPKHVSRDDVPADEVAAEKKFLTDQALASGRPANIIETRIIPGQMTTFFAQQCLLEQPFVADEKMTVGQMLSTLSTKVGETVVIRRFTRYQVGA